MKQNRTINRTGLYPWWFLPRRWKIALGCLAMLSLWLCLNPHWVDFFWHGFLWMVDYRLWPWWYFVEIVLVLLFSLHWFRCYAKCQRGELCEMSSVFPTLTVAAGMLIFTFCHRLLSFPLL